MAIKKSADSRCQVAAVQVTMSNTDTLTGVKFDFPYSVMDKIALVINRIEYWVAGLNQLNSTTDNAYMSLQVDNTTSPLSQNSPAVVDNMQILRLDIGTAATGLLFQNPFIKDFSTLPGGGILVAPSPLYGMMGSSGAAAAMSGWVKFWYNYIEMSGDEFWQLVESRRIISS